MYKYYFSSKFTDDGIPTELATKLTPPPQTNNLRPLGATAIQRPTDRGGDGGKAWAGEEEHGGY